jgi:uncharacterized metal-binding protein
MPSGVTHDRITIRILPWVVGITYLVTQDGELTLILAGSYLFSGMMFGPDLDIYSLQYKRWGLIRGIWLPYRKFLKHRSIFSHGLIIGTLLRSVYLLFIVAGISIFLVAIAQLCFGFPWNWQDFVRERVSILLKQYPQETLVLFLGLEIGAMSHSISDWISSRRKLKIKNQSSKPKRIRKGKIYQKKT